MSTSNTRIIEKAINDPAFRQKLIADPKAALAQELGTPVPDGIKIVVVEDTSSTVHLVLPPPSGNRQLTDTELEAVAGGYLQLELDEHDLHVLMKAGACRADVEKATGSGSGPGI